MEASNLHSARSNPAAVALKLDKEIMLGRVAGPFREPPLCNLRISP